MMERLGDEGTWRVGEEKKLGENGRAGELLPLFYRVAVKVL